MITYPTQNEVFWQVESLCKSYYKNKVFLIQKQLDARSNRFWIWNKIVI